MNVIYFQCARDHRYRELSPETPARIPMHVQAVTKEPQLMYLKDAEEFQAIDVFLDGAWVPGERVGNPTDYKFEVSIISFDPENTVWDALQKAMAKVNQSHDTPAPWFKVTPPSRRIPHLGEDTYLVISREDRSPDGAQGRFSLATRQVFQTEALAQKYADGISPSREPMVIPGRFNQLKEKE